MPNDVPARWRLIVAGLRPGLFDDWRRFEGFIRGEKLPPSLSYLDDQHPSGASSRRQPRRFYAVAADVETAARSSLSGHLPASEFAPGPGAKPGIWSTTTCATRRTTRKAVS
jgi:hypothetical protein